MPTTSPENWFCSLVITEIKLIAWVFIERILQGCGFYRIFISKETNYILLKNKLEILYDSTL